MSLATNPIFNAVRAHADFMLDQGRDPNPEDASPLFGGVVDPLTRAPIMANVIPPPGIRINDVSALGNNLMHDVPFLEVLLALARLTGEARYAEAVDAVFEFYPKHCPWPETGLFPWGEHAQWSFEGRRAMPNALVQPEYFLRTNAIIHEHLRFAPAWFWERMWATGPDAVVRFAHGLDRHLMNKDTFEHNRHAPLTAYAWNELPYTGQGKDFARHSGFFVFDCLFAFRKSGDRSLLDWARRKTAYHLERRLPNGIVRGCIRTPQYEKEGQHDSLALSLYDAAQAIGPETPEGAEFLGIARELFAARSAQPEELPVRGEELDLAWTDGYGTRHARALGVAGAEQLFDRTRETRYADRLIAAADWQMDVPPPPDDLPVNTNAVRRNLSAPLAAYGVTGDRRYLDRAGVVASWAIDRFRAGDLFLGGIGVEYHHNLNIAWSLRACSGKPGERPGYYFSGLGVPELQRDLLRLALWQEGEEDFLGTSSHYR